MAASGSNGSTPGGAGGGAARQGNNGGNGAAGQVVLNFASSSTPNNVVLRFLLNVPANSTPANNAVLVRGVVSSGTLTKIECQYTTASGGGVRIVGTGGAGFTSSSVTGINGLLLMVSLELATSGANLNWKIDTIQPGALASFGSQSGTFTTATIGAMSQVVVAPNGDINDTAIGQVVVQYALEPLTAVSDAINGHDGELVPNRFRRLCAEQNFTGTPLFNETKDHWGFESGTQSWTGASNSTVAQSTYTDAAPWPPEGTHSLQITPTTNAAFFAESPTGTSGLPVQPGDVVSVSAEADSNTAGNTITAAYVAIEWFTAAGASISVTTGLTQTVAHAVDTRLTVSGVAPATAAFFAIRAGGSGYSAATSLMIDGVTIAPQMGPQLNKKFTDLLQEIEDAGQGQLIEARDMLGMYFRTRVSLLNQSVAVTLNYANAVLSGQLLPIYDDLLTRNDVTVNRPNGSSANAQLAIGALSTQAPPNGVGDYTYTPPLNVHADTQLQNLANWIEHVGTVDQYRYPQIDIDLTRVATSVSGIFDAVPTADIGSYIQVTNPPSYVPESPIKQLAWGFTENLNAFQWYISVNDVPETPYEVTSYGWW